VPHPTSVDPTEKQEEARTVNLEGSLDAFGLPDVFSLLASTGKSGGLMLRRGAQSDSSLRGVVWFRDGRICGASSDRSRESLVRRVVGSGAVDDASLRQAVARAVSGGVGVARALVEAGAVETELMRQAATDQVTDAVFDLLRWPDGDFGFDQSALDVDDVGISLEHQQVLAEAQARAEAWAQLETLVPSPDSVLSVPVVLHHDPDVSRDEWALLALVDGRRRVRDLVELTGCGEFAVTTTLAQLVQRGLLHVRDASQPDHVTVVERRMAMLAGVETPVEPEAPAENRVAEQGYAAGPGAQGRTAAAALLAARAAQGLSQPGAPVPGTVTRSAPRREVVPPRPEPFLPGRRPEHPEPAEPVAPAMHHAAPVRTSVSAGVMTDGATARVLSDPSAMSEVRPDGLIERDPAVNRSLLLRLIAGVRGL
jgi:hypothetical protein